ncbi:MAG: site-specific integrase [Burkholderiales bacterium]
MSPLRKQMEADMAVRGLAYRTRETYVESVAKLAKFYGRGPDRISEAEVQRFLLHLLEERKLAHSSCNVMASALEFFYRVTLGRRETEFCLPRPKVPARLPQILSREEVARLIEKTSNLKHRTILMTTYAAGLRLSELCHLRVADIDSDRMTLRIEQGKGAKDRYTLLSARLLTELRRYWLAYRPGRWLFPAARMAEQSWPRLIGQNFGLDKW